MKLQQQNDWNTRRTFDGIADSWYRLRHRTRFKAELAELAERWGSGKLLNIGCAHGPDFLPFMDRFELYGIDSSKNMIELAIKFSGKYQFSAGLLVADAVSLPLKDHSFDCAIAVAVYHHVEKADDRDMAFAELKRVLKNSGEAFITVWNRWQREFLFKGKQVVVPWKMPDQALPRYHYLYDYGEIERKLRKHGFRILRSYPEFSYKWPLKWFSRNVCVLVKSV